MTGEDIIALVRILVNDNRRVQKWSDARFVDILNDAVAHIFYSHPESRLQDDGSILQYKPMGHNEVIQKVILHDTYRGALVSFICYRFFSADSEDSRDENRAAEHYKTYLEFFQPKGE